MIEKLNDKNESGWQDPIKAKINEIIVAVNDMIAEFREMGIEIRAEEKK